jgi:hypothetical protein
MDNPVPLPACTAYAAQRLTLDGQPVIKVCLITAAAVFFRTYAPPLTMDGAIRAALRSTGLPSAFVQGRLWDKEQSQKIVKFQKYSLLCRPSATPRVSLELPAPSSTEETL